LPDAIHTACYLAADSGRCKVWLSDEPTACDPIFATYRHWQTDATSTSELKMKFMILVKSNPELEAVLAATSDTQMKAQRAAMELFNEELRKAGVLKDCDGLRLSREGKRVRFDGKSRTVVDGPFKGDLVAGYWLWDLPSVEEAVAWVKRCPNPMPIPSEIEIRPI
jgi:hypothetical protein